MSALKINNTINFTPKNFTPKKFLFVSAEADSGDLAWQVKKEGHDVKFHVQLEENKDVCDGILNKVDSWQEHIGWADVIIFDYTGFGEVAEKLRKAGKLVVGGSIYTDKLEKDRGFGQEEMKKAGINILPTENFENFDEAIKFLKNNPARYVFKPCGEISSYEKGLLFVGQEEDSLDLIEVLEHNKNKWAGRIKFFQLQKFVSGIEIAVGGFFNGKEFVYPININFEHKRLFPGDIGPFTWEMGTLMFWDTKDNILFRQTLEKMKEPLAHSGYVGYIDINFIVNETGVYPIEFTSRFGYPTTSIQMEGILSSMGEFLYSIAKGEDFEIKTKKGFQLGVVVAVPPFPFKDEIMSETYKDSPILFKKKDLEGVHIIYIKAVDNEWRVAGISGWALIITGSGITVEEARAQAYNRIGNISLTNMFYRIDIGGKWGEESDKLQTWGYL